MKNCIIILLMLTPSICYAQSATIDTQNNVIVFQPPVPTPIPVTTQKISLSQCQDRIVMLNKILTQIQGQLTFWTNTCQQAVDAGLKTGTTKPNKP